MARGVRISSRVQEMGLVSKLIVINVVAFFLGLIFLSFFGEGFFNNIALNPRLFLSGKTLWTLLTSMFMHGSFFHLFANMFSLFFIGGFLEKIIGKVRFLKVYFLAGLVGGLFYVAGAWLFGGLDVPAVGASGAIFGLLGVLAVLVPYSKVYLVAGPLVLLIFDSLSKSLLPVGVSEVLSTIITLLIFMMIFSLFSFNSKFRKFSLPVELPMWLVPLVAIIPLILINQFVTPLPIGNSAHFGGLVVGLIYGFYLKNKFPRKTKRLSNTFR